jgi:hypothetical protein
MRAYGPRPVCSSCPTLVCAARSVGSNVATKASRPSFMILPYESGEYRHDIQFPGNIISRRAPRFTTNSRRFPPNLPHSAWQANLLLDSSYELVDPAPVVNAGALSYVRVSYAPSQVQSLAARMAVLPAADQLNLINDAGALGQSGYAPASDLLDYTSQLPSGADPIVWTRVIDLLLAIDQAQPASPAREAFRKFALTILAPVSREVGSAAKAGEDPAITAIRSQIWSTQARFGDAKALEKAKDLHASQKGSADERRTALAIIAHSADKTTFDALLSGARSTTDPQERSHILDALAQVGDPALAAQFVNVALGHDAPAGTAPGLLYAVAVENPDSVWHAVSLHLDDPNLPIDEQARAPFSFPRLRRCPRSRIVLLTCSNMPTNICQRTLGRGRRRCRFNSPQQASPGACHPADRRLDCKACARLNLAGYLLLASSEDRTSIGDTARLPFPICRRRSWGELGLASS